MDASRAKKLSLAVIAAMLIVTCLAAAGADAKKHKRLRLRCEQTTQEIFNTAERFSRSTTRWDGRSNRRRKGYSWAEPARTSPR